MSDLLNFLIENDDNFRRHRLPSLYADFSVQKTTNPDGYAANVAAWQEGLANAAYQGMLPSTTPTSKNITILKTGAELLRELDCPGIGRPAALATVVEEGVASRSMIEMHDFVHGKISVYDEKWTAALNPMAVLSWGVKSLTNLVGLSGSSTPAETESKVVAKEYVLLPNLEEVAGHVLETVSRQSTSMVDRIYSVEMFKNEFREIDDGQVERPLGETDFKVLLKYLSRDREEIAFDGHTIKFKAESEENHPTLSHEDKSIANLKTVLAKLGSQIKQLDRRISQLTDTANSAVKSQNRVSALSALRSRKLAEKALKQRSDTLAQLEEVYTNIETAADQVEIVAVMRASTKTLKSLHDKTGGIEKVEDVVDALREEMTKTEEIGGVLNEASAMSANSVDEAEVDEELEALLKEEKEAREAEETKRKLEELEKVEKEEREKKLQQEKEKESEIEAGMKRVSIEEGKAKEAPEAVTAQ